MKRSKTTPLFFLFLLTSLCLYALQISTWAVVQEDRAPGRKIAKQAVKGKELQITTDHKKQTIERKEVKPWVRN